MSEKQRVPSWLTVKAKSDLKQGKVFTSLRSHHVHTVCENALCPNRWECFQYGTATFLILGEVCSRNCRFCAIKSGRLAPPEENEPHRVALTVKELGLKHAVVTSVTRDDLPDGGARHFAKTILEIRRLNPETTVEVLTPDFQGDEQAIAVVMEAKPDVFNHNVETVPRLYQMARPQADYERSLFVLEQAKKLAPDIPTKSGIMLGLGEEKDGVVQVMQDLRRVNCDILTIGQYLRPSGKQLPVKKYVTPEEFAEYKEIAYKLDFAYVESGPFVRSSYHAERAISEPNKNSSIHSDG